MSSIKEKIWGWGYVMDHVPSAAPFIFGRTKCSLERELTYLGLNKCFYMNSMFNSDYVQKYFPDTTQECYTNCLDNRLSDAHFEYLAQAKEIFCTLEHGNYVDSARQIARISLKNARIKGIHIDDFNNGGKLDLSYDQLKAIREVALEINPALKLAVVTYSHFPVARQIEPFVELIDMVSRWCWIPSEDYWDNHADDIRHIRECVGPDKKIVQGFYIHDFGSSMKCQYPVPMNIFKKSVETVCEHTYDGTLDGFIIPQAGWFSFPNHFEHISWLKQYLDWFEETSDLR